MSDYNNSGDSNRRDRRHDDRRSTQGFEEQNAFRFNRGSEGDQNWRRQDYDQNDYRDDNGRRGNYGERYGFSGYGRAEYNPEQNRDWQENEGFRSQSWNEGQPFSNREQDYRGGRWDRATHDYQNAGTDNWNSSQQRPEGRLEGRGARNEREMEPESFQRGIPSGMEQFGGNQNMRAWSQDSGTGSPNMGSSTRRGSYQTYGGSQPSWTSGRGLDNQPASRGGNMSGYGTLAQYNIGPHTGKGPKNYKRSDSRIEEDVCESLAQHPAIDASEIEVKVQNGEVVLSGTVPDRSMKRMVEDTIENLPGVRDVTNQLRVAQAGDSRSGDASSKSSNGSGNRSNAGSSATGSSNSSSNGNGHSASNASMSSGSNGGSEEKNSSETTRRSKPTVS